MRLNGICLLDALASGRIVLQHAVVSYCKTTAVKTSPSPTSSFSQKKKKGGGRGEVTRRRREKGVGGCRKWRRKEKIWVMKQPASFILDSQKFFSKSTHLISPDSRAVGL